MSSSNGLRPMRTYDGQYVEHECADCRDLERKLAAERILADETECRLAETEETLRMTKHDLETTANMARFEMDRARKSERKAQRELEWIRKHPWRFAMGQRPPQED